MLYLISAKGLMPVIYNSKSVAEIHYKNICKCFCRVSFHAISEKQFLKNIKMGRW